MAQQNINIGSSANDGTGDPLRTAFDKINDNFDELYGSTAEANDLIEDSTPQLGGDLDVNGRRITSARSNEDIILLPNGTGGVVASAVRIAGTTLSSDDSSSITIAEGLQANGAVNIDGAVTMASTLAVTGVATFTATPVFSGDITLTDDLNLTSDSAVITFGADTDTTLTHTDGTGLTLNSTNKLCFNDASQFIQGSSATVLSIGATDEIDLTATDIDVNGTMSVSGTLTTASIATTGTHTITGTAAIDGVTITDNTISTNASNANLEISANGTGTVDVEGVSFFGTTLTAADSSTININEGLVVDGTVTVSGTTNTADVATTGNTTVTGNSTVAGDLTVAGSINADNIISSSNGDITIDPAGTGAIKLTGPITATGTQTTTGQLNVDNLRLDGNVLSATSGGITLTPADGQNVTVSGTNTNLTAGEANFTLCEATTLRTNALQNDTSDGDLAISTQGTGAVTVASQLTLTGSFLPAIHTFVATDAVTITEHAGRTLLLGEVGGNALVTLTLPDATGSGATYKFIVTVANTSNYVIKVPDSDNTIDGIMMYLDEDGTAVSAFPTVAASDTITLNGGTTGGLIGDYLEIVDIAADQYHVRGVMRVAAGANPATPFSATV